MNNYKLPIDNRRIPSVRTRLLARKVARVIVGWTRGFGSVFAGLLGLEKGGIIPRDWSNRLNDANMEGNDEQKQQ